MMTVAEIIEKLKEFPADMPVLQYDDENLILNDIEWVGEMGNEKVAGVVIHGFQPSGLGDWIVRA